MGKRKSFIEQLEKIKITPESWNQNESDELNCTVKAKDFLKRPTITLDQICQAAKIDCFFDRETKIAIESDIKYSGFIQNQESEIEKCRRLEEEKIPEDFDYSMVNGLLTESRTKMKKIKPATLGQAARIPGVTPADISIIALHLVKQKK